MGNAFTIRLGLGALFVAVVIGALFSFPTILTISIQHEQEKVISAMHEQFPVTVNPKEKIITEDALVNAFLESDNSPMQAAAWSVGRVFGDVFAWVAIAIADAPLYQSLASADGRFVNITPGMRKEQVANAFAGVLGWNAKQKKEFLTTSPYSSLPLPEGSFSPGIYLVLNGTKPLEAQAMVNDKFSDNVLSRYNT